MYKTKKQPNKLLNKHGKPYREKDVKKSSKRKNISKDPGIAPKNVDKDVPAKDLFSDSYSELIGSLKKKPKKYFEEIMDENSDEQYNDTQLTCNIQDSIEEEDHFDENQILDNDSEEEISENVKNFKAKFGSDAELHQSSISTMVDVPNALYSIKKSSKCKLGNEVIRNISDLKNTGLEPPLLKQWVSITKQIESKGVMRPLSSLIYPYMAIGSDVLFSQSTFGNLSQIQKLLALHTVDHIFKTRKCVLKNNKKIADNSSKSENIEDQGYTRPTVLIVLPFKNIAYDLVQEIIKIALTGTKRQVSSKKRFNEEYGPDSEEKPNLSKSLSYQKTFLGNNDDFFTLGVALAKNSVKLFTSFYNSDLIIASPLGLRNLIGAEGDIDRDYDFLSSIEILGILGCDMFLMQNWEHLIHTLNHLNLQPVKDQSTDFSRVKKWVLEGHGKQYRQNLVFGAWSCPEISSLFGKEFQNHRGTVMVSPSVQTGSLSEILMPVKQLFLQMRIQNKGESRIEYMTNGRYNYFIQNLMPRFLALQNVVIVLPSYFDFVRLRNYMKKEETQFSVLSEYSSNKTITNTRRQFAEGNVKLLLTTERFFFFKRYNLKDVSHVVFYEPPLYPECYTHYVNMLTLPDSSSNLLYNKYDYERLERIVGEKQLKTILISQQKTHMIISQ